MIRPKSGLYMIDRERGEERRAVQPTPKRFSQEGTIAQTTVHYNSNPHSLTTTHAVLISV